VHCPNNWLAGAALDGDAVLVILPTIVHSLTKRSQFVGLNALVLCFLAPLTCLLCFCRSSHSTLGKDTLVLFRALDLPECLCCRTVNALGALSCYPFRARCLLGYLLRRPDLDSTRQQPFGFTVS
jgi:hypothetical protein